MKAAKRIDLLYVPANVHVEARIVPLTPKLIVQKIDAAWWSEDSIHPRLAEGEIDRHWDWANLQIEHDGQLLRSRKVAIQTGDHAVQGAMLFSTESVPCESEPDQRALFVELLFVAPRNRRWIRKDDHELFRGVGLELLRYAAEQSIQAHLGGRLKLDASPDFITWYERRGLHRVSAHPILHEGVPYTPMELSASSVKVLLPDFGGTMR